MKIMIPYSFLYFLLITLFTNFNNVESEEIDDLLVDTTQGAVLGKENKFEGFKINQWLAIPYAQPPIGELRFRAPVKAEPWAEIKFLNDEPPACPQRENSIYKILDKSFYMWVPPVEMNEDCLYLNVYTPSDAKRRGNLPVIVWIHGGGFDRGAISMDVYNPKMLVAKEDVIVVTVQYRLGILGLLYFDSSDSPGNMGLMDQSMALQWVQDNIEKFGGNKNAITLMGESAGAAAVGYHMISPHSKNLFQKAIVQSGAPMTFWAFSSPEEALRRSYKFAQHADCKFPDVTATLDCLRKKSSSEILNSIKSILPLTPTVDGKFLTISPFEAIQKKEFAQKAVLGGLVQSEGMSGLLSFVSHVKTFDFSHFDKDNYEFVKSLMALFFKQPRNKVEELTRFYSDEGGSSDYLGRLSHLFGDAFSSCATLDFLSSISSAGVPTYLYYYNHRPEKCPDPLYTEVMHGAEVPFQFGLPFWIKENYTDVDRQISQGVMSEWASFVKTGKPGKASWGQYEGELGTYEELKSDQSNTVVMRREPFCKAWNQFGSYQNIVSVAEVRNLMLELCKLKYNAIKCGALSFAQQLKEVLEDIFNF